MKITQLLLLALLLTAGCGQAATPGSRLSAATPRPTTRHVPVPPRTGPHFATPEAAMRYLAAAWNADDLTELKHVTDPMARGALIDMYHEAKDLRLDHCVKNDGSGDYQCFFRHAYPVGYQTKNTSGTAEFTVGPADRPGWYMTAFESCG